MTKVRVLHARGELRVLSFNGQVVIEQDDFGTQQTAVSCIGVNDVDDVVAWMQECMDEVMTEAARAT